MEPAFPKPNPIAHDRPAEGEAHELLAIERVMLVMRLAGVLVLLAMTPLYPEVHLGLVALALAALAATIVVQLRVIGPDVPVPELRRRSLAFLASDMLTVYVIGTAFVASPDWIGFYFYPLLALEAAVLAGLRGGLVVTAISIGVYLAQVALTGFLGNAVTVRDVAGGLALLGLTGGFVAAVGMTAQRSQRDMRALLDLTSALAHQRDEAETIELLDQRLRDTVGGRVRSVAIRREDGSFEILRWHSTERRTLERTHIERTLGDIEALATRFHQGTSLTWSVDEGSPLGTALGLPEWARSVTLVPIFVERRWIGVLPVLWPTRVDPDARQMRLLYGLANQVGLALAQGQLQRVREQAATDALTGLMNRRAIRDELAAAVARSARSGEPLAILFGDLDGFKAVNDSRGHDAGDDVLRLVASAVRRALRAGDVLGRYGGDELLIVAEGTGVPEAATLARRIGEAVRSAAGADGIDITFGVAAYPTDADSPDALLVAADRAMYRGKLEGPGWVVLAAGVRPADDADRADAADAAHDARDAAEPDALTTSA
ncbi:MAG TPA: GGDEF domain-containing protein [Candidatus Limnocylindrales bacterium]|nr:GGDEF domain-containing protein [Candidatus Limnocylindrales bacterium]